MRIKTDALLPTNRIYVIQSSETERLAKEQIAHSLGKFIVKNVDISFSKVAQPPVSTNYQYRSHVYVLSQSDYEEIKEDIDLLIEHNPRLKTQLKDILKKILQPAKTVSNYQDKYER